MAANTEPDERSYTAEELAHLAAKYAEIIKGWQQPGEPYGVAVLRSWHLDLFADIRPGFAGRVRSADFGESIHMLGTHPSVERSQVGQELDKHERLARHFDAQVRSGLEAEEVIRAAVILHCDLIPIQPFHDGNKQIARLAMSHWLRRWHMPAPSLSVPREEYLTCVESYLAGDKSCQMMLDLVIRLMTDQTR